MSTPRQIKFKSAFQRITFTHGIAIAEEGDVFGVRFVLRLGRMKTSRRLDDAEIRQLEVAVSALEIEQSVIEPGDLARLKFAEAFTKLSST